jgi:hypothetical protein
MQNGFCESLNGRMGDELLNDTLFFGLDHAGHKGPCGIAGCSVPPGEYLAITKSSPE